MNNTKSCNICEKTYFDSSTLKKHINTVHNKQKDRKCDSCGKAFTNNSLLNVHIKRVHREKNKIKRVHEDNKSEKNLCCDKCGAVFSSISNRNRHIKNNHSCIKNYNEQIPKMENNDQKKDEKATEFREKSSSNGTSNENSDMKIRSTTTSCEICGQKFDNLNVHLYQNHFKQQIKDDYGEMFQQSVPNCPAEGCSFKNEQRPDLLRHFLVSHNILKIYLEKAMADKTYPKNNEKLTKNTLDNANNINNENIDIKPIKIEDQFTNSAPNSSTQEYVLKNNKSDEPFQCNFCPKAFGRKEHLKRHVLRVHGDRDHECNHCGKRFQTNEHLKVHERIHTGDKPYQCQFCDLKFTQKSQSLQHERIHSGKKPYCCNYCTEQFTQKSQVQQHEKHRHTGIY